MKCAAATHQLFVAPTYFPYSTFREASSATRTVARADDIVIPTAVYSLPCSSESPTTALSISQVWTVHEPSAVVGEEHPEPLLVAMSNETQSLVLPAYSFPSDTLYKILEVVTITVVDSVSNVQTTATFDNLIVVKVQKSPVKALLSSTGHVWLGLSETNWMDASGSYDSNASPGAEHDGLRYHWECVRMGPLTVESLGTDCSGFLLVNASFHSQAALSPTFVRNGESVVLDSEYRITLFVYSADKLEFDSIVLKASTTSFCCVAVELEPVDRYNAKEYLRVSANVQSSVRGYLAWSISGVDSSVLSEAALTPSGFAFEEPWLSLQSSLAVHLVLPPNLLGAGFSYTIQLTFIPLHEGQSVDDVLDTSAVFSSIEIVPNSLPLPGVFTVTPGEGWSLLDSFSFSAHLWSSDQMPLLYSFGFQSVSSGLVVPLVLPSAEVKISGMLPQGSPQKDFSLTCVLHVYDAIDARSEEVVEVKVSPSGISRQECPAPWTAWSKETLLYLRLHLALCWKA